MYTKYPNWCSWISKLMIVYWPVFCKILFTGLYCWNLLHLSVIWRVHTYSSHTYWIKTESNKVISVLAQTQVHMASKAFWAGTANPSGAPEFTPVFSGVRVTRSLVLYLCIVGHCLSFCTFLLAIVLSVLLRYTDSDFPFGIFKLLLHMKIHRNQIINLSVFFHPISDGGLFHLF
jgi:hypothetical protein